MKPNILLNYARDGWVQGQSGLADVQSAVTGEVIAATGSAGLDVRAMLDHARKVGGPDREGVVARRRGVDARSIRQVRRAVVADES